MVLVWEAILDKAGKSSAHSTKAPGLPEHLASYTTHEASDTYKSREKE